MDIQEREKDLNMHRHQSFVWGLVLGAMFFWSGTSFAWHAERVKMLAHEADTYAQHVHRQAEAEMHHGDWAEREAIVALHELAEAASHLHGQLESYYASPEHTWQDFQRLEYAYRRASQSLHWAHFTQHVLQDFYRFEDAFYGLQHEYYGHGGGHGGPWPPHHDGADDVAPELAIPNS